MLLKGECQGTSLACHEYTWVDGETTIVQICEMIDLWILISFYVEGIIAGDDGDMYKGILCLSCTKGNYACPGGR